MIDMNGDFCKTWSLEADDDEQLLNGGAVYVSFMVYSYNSPIKYSRSDIFKKAIGV